ncbi:uncharacterized protein LOC119072797 [Bradysia coprophila]|uniref:uncharacterized protein LOC119072797 n=1 Tax=Bradysia coprophila TaxID=38358 RepID=UPI00187DB44D|nr:uncharacterized protein LOC119072797 [Bradysia coprophila]
MSNSSICDNTVHDCNDMDNEYYMFAGNNSCLEEFIVLNKCVERDEFFYDTLVDATELDFSGNAGAVIPKSVNQIDPIPAPAASAIRFQSSKDQLDKLDMMAEDETETDKDAKWSALTAKLNELGPARSTQNWKRIWAARKYNLKRSASQKRKLETSTENLEEPKRDHQIDCVERSGFVDDNEKSSICVCARTSKLEEPKKNVQISSLERSGFVEDNDKLSGCVCACAGTSNIFPIIVEKLDALINLMKTSNSLLSKLLDK